MKKRMIKMVIPIAKPRNPLALAARQRRAGAHEKSHKAKRRDDKQTLRTTVLTLLEEESGFAALLFS